MKSLPAEKREFFYKKNNKIDLEQNEPVLRICSSSSVAKCVRL